MNLRTTSEAAVRRSVSNAVLGGGTYQKPLGVKADPKRGDSYVMPEPSANNWYIRSWMFPERYPYTQ